MDDSELFQNIERLHPDAFGWAVHCCGQDAALAEDVLQEAYAKLIQGRVKHDGSAHCKSWWFGIVRFTAMEELRRRRRQDSRLLSFLRGLWPLGDATADARPQPCQQLELSEDSARVVAAISQLSERQAEVMHLVFYQDLPLSEAAAVMHVGIGSVRQHYERGKQRLRELLQTDDVP
jgi:RNA polymerase sigma factor (sigma-70 family)